MLSKIKKFLKLNTGLCAFAPRETAPTQSKLNRLNSGMGKSCDAVKNSSLNTLASSALLTNFRNAENGADSYLQWNVLNVFEPCPYKILSSLWCYVSTRTKSKIHCHKPNIDETTTSNVIQWHKYDWFNLHFCDSHLQFKKII